MKGMVMLWLMTAGIGVSYAIYEERKTRINLLKEMVQTLGKLSYFVYQWRMPLEEALRCILKENVPVLHTFLEEVLNDVVKKEEENLGNVWAKKSAPIFSGKGILKGIEDVWSQCFINIPLERDELHNNLFMRQKAIQVYLEELQDKYKVEQKLVWTLGICSSAFLCLIIW